METIRELIDRLRQTDETTTIEAKRGSSIDRSIMETVCAFANEPSLGGGCLLLGVAQNEAVDVPDYLVEGVTNADKLQSDLASQCATVFNLPVRPSMDVEMVEGKLVLRVTVDELAAGQKPLYFRKGGLPGGAYRRIGPTDQQCTEDDLLVFYNQPGQLDETVVADTSWADVDEDALTAYRRLRAKANAQADELAYADDELLRALHCGTTVGGQFRLTYAGLLVFGSRMAQRRLVPALRVDYIRVPGTEWVADPDNRFTTVDMRGPLITLLGRAYNAVADDLPRGFALAEGELQAQPTGMPERVLREALVNALMHRSYRINEPTQIIRYSNRIEIRNPGFSLKPEEQLGEPGSVQRNAFIAAVFHETNLAETKGSGIRTMRRLLADAQLAPPTFESDHATNHFVARLLLHHFLSEADLRWLAGFGALGLTDAQKKALIFVREVGAINNATYRQLNGCDALRAGLELRTLRDRQLLEAKGRGRAAYYVSGPLLVPQNESVPNLSEPVPNLSEPVPSLSEPAPNLSEPPPASNLPQELQASLKALGRRSQNVEATGLFIRALCAWRPHTLTEIARLLGKRDKYLLNRFIKPLREAGHLRYTIPDMPNHPGQAYEATAL